MLDENYRESCALAPTQMRRMRRLAAAVVERCVCDVDDHLRAAANEDRALTPRVAGAVSFLFLGSHARVRELWLGYLDLNERYLDRLLERPGWRDLVARIKAGSPEVVAELALGELRD